MNIHSHHKLVELSLINPRIITDIRYATVNNFTKTKLYPIAVCFIVKEVAYKLHEIQTNLEALDLGLKIWDAYRPHAIQYQLWQAHPDIRYVGNPTNGSRHNRGAAVDCTLVDVYGQELDMGTHFDCFSEKAHRNYPYLESHAKKNRDLLDEIMQKHGFVGLPSEWWHFDYKEWERYPLLNINLEHLKISYDT